jgi:hypothetical protein
MFTDGIVYKWIESSCDTMDELQAYRGLMWKSRANKKAFQSFWEFH